MVSKNSGSTVLSEFSIPGVGGYDGAGNILNRADTIAGETSYSGSTSYQYDIKNQLTQETSTRGSGYTNNFAYDGGTVTGAGNPTSFKGVTNTFNADNQYTNTGYSYDGEGNPTTYNGTTLTFDAEDRMTAFGTALTNGYLSSGLRAWKQNNSGTRTYFLYDGTEPVCEVDTNGNVLGTNTFGADGLISRHVGSSSTFYTFDTQGGNAQRLDSSGSILASAMFDAYGSHVSSDGSTDPFSGYGGQWGYYSDSETGLELCTYRFYDPAIGRFINRDPIGYDGGVNIYSYVGNNPSNYMDPLGTENVNHSVDNDALDKQINDLLTKRNGGGLTSKQREQFDKEIRALRGKKVTNQKGNGERNKGKRDEKNSTGPCPAAKPKPNPFMSFVLNLLPGYVDAGTSEFNGTLSGTLATGMGMGASVAGAGLGESFAAAGESFAAAADALSGAAAWLFAAA